jgi:hypothetical protein
VTLVWAAKRQPYRAVAAAMQQAQNSGVSALPPPPLFFNTFNNVIMAEQPR